MILEHVVLPVIVGKEADFEASFAQARPIISSMPGFVSLRIERGIEHPNHYLMLVEWERLEDHTEGFRGSPQYGQWRALLHHFYDPVPTVDHYQPLRSQAVTPAERWRRVAGGFTTVVNGVEPNRWDDPSPCEGWVARDIVRHLVDWMPYLFFEAFGVARPAMGSADDDPGAAWHALDAAIVSALEDPAVASIEADIMPGHFRLDDAVANFGIGDILVHTWDLAQATGQHVVLDPDDVSSMLGGVEAMGDALEASGQYGPALEVPEGADDQTRLLAFVGRRA